MNTIKGSTVYVVETGIWLCYEDDHSTMTIESYNSPEGLAKAILEQSSEGFQEAYKDERAYIRVQTLEEWVKARARKVSADALPWFMTAE